MDDRTADESMSVIVEQMRVHLMRLRRGAEVEEESEEVISYCCYRVGHKTSPVTSWMVNG
jgi:hypothetical protein